MDAPAESDHPNANSLPFHRRYFAQRMVYPAELPSIMRRHIYTGAMGNVWGTLISGVFFVYFGSAIGLSPSAWGVMAGLSSFLLTGELIAARLTRQVGQRKILWFWFAVASRSVRLLGILLAYWLWHEHHAHAAHVLIAAVCLSNFLGSMSNPPWMSWLADIIPHEKHGRFWARRTWWINVSVIFAVLPSAWLIDCMTEEWKLTAAVAIFFVATVIGLIDLVIHGTIPEPAMVVPQDEDFTKQFLDPVRDRGYRRWLVFIGCWTFGMSLGGSLCTVYFIDDLGLKDNMVAGIVVLTILSQFGTLLGSRKWGLYVDRYGVRPVLFWGHLFWAFLPLFWIFATKDTVVYFLGASSILGGSASNAGVIAANKLITRYPPPGHHVATYTAVSSCVSNWAGGFGALAAGAVLALFGKQTWCVHGFTFGAFHVIFAVSFVLRMASALFLLPRIRVPQQLDETPPETRLPEGKKKLDWASLLRP